MTSNNDPIRFTGLKGETSGAGKGCLDRVVFAALVGFRLRVILVVTLATLVTRPLVLSIAWAISEPTVAATKPFDERARPILELGKAHNFGRL